MQIDTGRPRGETSTTWWLKMLRRLLPPANPDLEPYFSRTQIWWLEIDDDGTPRREIGFDKDGEAIVLGPVEGNFGFLIDASDDWRDSKEDSPKAARDFDAVWDSLWPKFKKLDEGNR